ncbi:unnamed protein product, partial [Closterium sp. NIES-65]
QLVSNIRRLKDPGKGENSKRVLLSGANLLLLSQNNLVEAAGATSIWPSVTDDRGWITHVMRFAADLIADSPVQMDSRKRTYITEAISFVRDVGHCCHLSSILYQAICPAGPLLISLTTI